MPDPNKETAPDLAAEVTRLTGLVADLGKTMQTLATGQQQLVETFGRAQPAAAQSAAPAPQATTAAAGKPLTLDDVARAVRDGLAADQQTRAKSEARDRYAAEKLKDLPAVYRAKLPATDDAAALSAAEQAIRAEFKSDFAALGGRAADVSGTPPPGGQPPAAAVDYTKLSPQAAIEAGLKQSRAVGAAPTSATGANAAAK